MIELLTSPEAWAALLTLTALEIVLGIDNVIFIAILSGRLPQEQQAKARRLAATDDAALCEALGIAVRVVRGSERLMKITEEADFARADAMPRAEP